MKILIRSTTLDGEPIPGSGETIQAADCPEVVELMRGQTPFTASRAPRDYMTEVLSGIEAGRSSHCRRTPPLRPPSFSPVWPGTA
jgi:hypothetical protein